MNKVILIGRLTADPELRTTPNGISVATFTLAVNRNFSSASGEREADFIRCVTFRNQADTVARYIGKGSKVAVEGRIQTGSYEAPDGTRRYTTDVVCDTVEFLDVKSQNEPQQSYGYNQPYTNQPAINPGMNQGFNQNNFGQVKPNYSQPKDDFFNDSPNVDISEDDLPF